MQRKINEIIHSPDFYSKLYLETELEKSLQEITLREVKLSKYNYSFISIAKYIEENYNKILLFYSMNHPTKHLLQYICSEIFNLLNLEKDINYDIDPLDAHKMILYESYQKVVKFDIHEYIPQITTESEIIKGENEMIDCYIEQYKTMRKD